MSRRRELRLYCSQCVIDTRESYRAVNTRIDINTLILMIMCINWIFLLNYWPVQILSVIVFLIKYFYIKKNIPTWGRKQSLIFLSQNYIHINFMNFKWNLFLTLSKALKRFKLNLTRQILRFLRKYIGNCLAR